TRRVEENALLVRAVRPRDATPAHRRPVAVLELVQGSLQHGALADSRFHFSSDNVRLVHSGAALVARPVVAVAGCRLGHRTDDRHLAGEGTSASEAALRGVGIARIILSCPRA